MIPSTILTFILCIMFTATLTAQLNFDMGNSHIAVRNSWSQEAYPVISPTNLLFDADLANSHRYAVVDYYDLPTGNTFGYNACWSSNFQPSGDINYVIDTLGCGEYEFRFAVDFAFRLDLTDANWGGGDDNSVYKFLIDYLGTGTVNLYVRSPGAQGTWSSPIAVSNGDRFSYWGLIQATHDANYIRERTSHNGISFHVTGADNQLPLPSTGVSDARLDVNLAVHTDIEVPTGRSLLIEGFAASGGGASNTTLLFDAATGLTVRGTLRTVETRYQSEWVNFTSSGQSPGDWTGIHCLSATQVWLNYTNILYAVDGLYAVECGNVEAYDTYIQYCSFEGLYMLESNGVFHRLRSGHNGGNGVRIQSGSRVELHDSRMLSSSAANGVLVLDNSEALIRKSDVLYNAGHGVAASAGGRVVIDSCYMMENGSSGADGWAGVYGLYNDEWITLRNSRVHWHHTGVRMDQAMVNGYESVTNPVEWHNADSLARNCIYENEYNLFAYYGLFELGRTYYNGTTPHYQGGESSVYYPGQLQGAFFYSQVWAERVYWHGNTLFNVNNSMLSTEDALDSDLAGCLGGDMIASSGMITHGAAMRAQYRAWEGLTADSLMQTLYDARSTLTRLEASAGLGLLWRSADRGDVERWLGRLIAGSQRSETLYPAYRYLAAARMRAGDWSGARSAFESMAGHTVASGDEGYTGAMGMAALTRYLGGEVSAARATLDTLLQAYPDDLALRTVRTMIGAGAGISTPKAAAAPVSAPSGYALHAAYPNPFRSATEVSFTLPERASVALTVHDMSGRLLRRLADGEYAEGRSVVRFDGSALPAGVYLLRLSAGNTLLTRTVTIVR